MINSVGSLQSMIYKLIIFRIIDAIKYFTFILKKISNPLFTLSNAGMRLSID